MLNLKDNIEQIISDQSIELERISLEICKGIQDGVWSGMKKGVKRGFRKGLTECLFKGPTDIQRDDIKDISRSIKDSAIKNGVEEGVGFLCNLVTQEFVDLICPKVAKEFKNANVTPSDADFNFVSDMAMRYQENIMTKAMNNLPQNPLYKPIFNGINTAMKFSIQKSLDKCRQNILILDKNSGSTGMENV